MPCIHISTSYKIGVLPSNDNGYNGTLSEDTQSTIELVLQNCDQFTRKWCTRLWTGEITACGGEIVNSTWCVDNGYPIDGRSVR